MTIVIIVGTNFLFSTSDVTCDQPSSGVNANLTTTSQIFRYQNTVNYTCNNPAAMVTQGNLTLTCEADGHWSDSPPVCGECLIDIVDYIVDYSFKI